jgi:TetR/AcrR family transcriptional regulator
MSSDPINHRSAPHAPLRGGDVDEKISRRDQILQALAYMLEAGPGERITTAALAKTVGVSEAALYRHFPSKAKMFEGLIEFIEHTIFARIASTMREETSAMSRCEKILGSLLTFAERNPGISRILTGDALTGETERLRVRINHFYEKIETELRKVLNEAERFESIRTTITVSAAANLLLSTVEGRISQFVRSDFKSLPTKHWQDQWPVLMEGFFRAPVLARSQLS